MAGGLRNDFRGYDATAPPLPHKLNTAGSECDIELGAPGQRQGRIYADDAGQGWPSLVGKSWVMLTKARRESRGVMEEMMDG